VTWNCQKKGKTRKKNWERRSGSEEIFGRFVFFKDSNHNTEERKDIRPKQKKKTDNFSQFSGTAISASREETVEGRHRGGKGGGKKGGGGEALPPGK